MLTEESNTQAKKDREAKAKEEKPEAKPEKPKVKQKAKVPVKA